MTHSKHTTFELIRQFPGLPKLNRVSFQDARSPNHLSKTRRHYKMLLTEKFGRKVLVEKLIQNAT